MNCSIAYNTEKDSTDNIQLLLNKTNAFIGALQVPDYKSIHEQSKDIIIYENKLLQKNHLDTQIEEIVLSLELPIPISIIKVNNIGVYLIDQHFICFVKQQEIYIRSLSQQEYKLFVKYSICPYSPLVDIKEGLPCISLKVYLGYLSYAILNVPRPTN